MAAERPLVGWGPVNNKYELGIRLDERIHRRRDAHNLLLEVLTATGAFGAVPFLVGDRKSTRLNSSHSQISYAVFCLKKKKTQLIHAQGCDMGNQPNLHLS